ncbi:MAG: DUF4345 domain-containing protein [Actinomycetota bacterium]
MSTTADSAATAGGNERPPRWALRGALGFVGVFIVFFSLNMSLGGFETLGWEGRSDFVDVTNQDEFGIQDNHVRFASGVWTGLGLVFLAGTRWLDELRILLVGALVVMAIGGLARLSSADASVITSPDVLTALALELVAVPLLAWWILRSTAPADRQVALPAADGYQRISSRSRPRISGVGRCSSASIS